MKAYFISVKSRILSFQHIFTQIEYFYPRKQNNSPKSHLQAQNDYITYTFIHTVEYHQEH